MALLLYLFLYRRTQVRSFIDVKLVGFVSKFRTVAMLVTSVTRTIFVHNIQITRYRSPYNVSWRRRGEVEAQFYSFLNLGARCVQVIKCTGRIYHAHVHALISPFHIKPRLMHKFIINLAVEMYLSCSLNVTHWRLKYARVIQC